MKITVKIDSVEVVIDRPSFGDYGDRHIQEARQNIMKDTVIPMLTEATNKAKELFNLKNQ